MPQLLVLGDLMLDRYTFGVASRISPEAPVVVLEAEQDEVRLGGAASVAQLLRGLESRVTLVGVVGDDSDGRTLRRIIEEAGIDGSGVLTDPQRPTTCKERFLGRGADRSPGGGNQMLRVDRESRLPVSEVLGSQIVEFVRAQLPHHAALLVSDYAKGVCTPELLQEVISAARAVGVPILVDPARIADYARYRGVTLIKPNRMEAGLATGISIRSPEEAAQAALRLQHNLQVESVVITLDQEGLVFTTPNPGSREVDHSVPHVPTRECCQHLTTAVRTVLDITGAGDTVLAVLGWSHANGRSLSEATHLANRAAGLQIERLGVATISRDELFLPRGSERSATPPAPFQKSVTPARDKQITLSIARDLADAYRRQGKTIVFTNGCFDLLHVGHVTYLEQAARLGDVLIVAINSDDSVRRLKGPTRPIITADQRAAMLAALGCVDQVLVFDEPTPHRLLETIRPDVLVKGGTTAEIVGREVVEAYGARVLSLHAVEAVSTTDILARVDSLRLPFQTLTAGSTDPP
ncbi:MAG: bifunctional heptose 7-phosphate kinase/heptose 1-phosphate adenyltransferase [Planctomycetota bacterium]|nr:bifunctional heptose 7-phosphate kinase/heptose 1-phosphate adenyltransferase [Planctomycetota bacterium]